MTRFHYPLLAREGWVHTALAVGAAALVHYYVGALPAIPFWIAVVFTVQFFRDPPRTIPAAPLGVLCPADGRVISLGDAYDPYLKRPAKRVSIFMNAFNVHSNRMPTEGRVMEIWYHAGKFFNAALEKASESNERNAVWVRTDEGADVVVVQVAGLIARRILCYVKPGDRAAQGERYGFIRFGSRVDVYLPPDSRFRTALGDRVQGGTTLIAELPGRATAGGAG
ncbi:phosphatidylserine decarboxylase [Sulfurifustis variabilis]|uniref:Phosphatidylserine decarboxylase proenzyme n=1 Tax=Sulfurifustis variabilis TaxID=1675686 RepID=A0A1B4V203_9GAMM|nr:phosphatidylserine decarboxylase [Sulfurifustis variabilis]BAU47315.1 phosphatidylserine decarboxylase [Sulfurifustis variabilis]